MWIALLILIALLLVYSFIVRPMLKTMPAFSTSFAAEASAVEKLQARLTGWKTKIASRLVAIAGVLIGLYDEALPFVTGQDWTPLTQKVPAWTLPVGLMFLGIIFDWLRRVTANPPAVITQKIAGLPDPVVVAVQQPPKA